MKKLLYIALVKGHILAVFIVVAVAVGVALADDWIVVGGKVFSAGTSTPPVLERWTPEYLDTVFWLDAQDADSITEFGGLVSNWDDISGEGMVVTQSVGSGQPTYQAAGFNGLPCVNFTSDRKVLQGTFTVTNDTTWAFFLIGYNATSAFFLQDVMNFSSSTPSSPLRVGARTGTGAFEGLLNAPGTLHFTAGFIGDKMITWELNETAGRVSRFRNTGTEESTNVTWASTDYTLDGTFAVGGKPGALSGQQYYNGQIAELLVIRGGVTEDERKHVEGYLAWKWDYTDLLPDDHPYKNIRPYRRAPWTPALLGTHAAVWYDAADASTITINISGSVSQWDDKSGNTNNATQGSLNNQPRWGDTYKINGVNAIDFDAVGFQQDQLFLDTLITGQSEIYTFMVVDFDTLTGGNGVLHDVGSTTDFLGGGTGGSPRSKYANQNFAGGTSFGTSAAQIGLWLDSSLDVYHSVNGQLTPDNQGTFSTGTDWSFGRLGRNGSDTIDGLVGEVIVTTTEPSVADRQKIEGYLAWKWGLQDELPDDHPFKHRRPNTGDR